LTVSDVTFLMAVADLDDGDRRPVLLGDVVLADDADVVIAGIGVLDRLKAECPECDVLRDCIGWD
jgi:hypothetical protein